MLRYPAHDESRGAVNESGQGRLLPGHHYRLLVGQFHPAFGEFGNKLPFEPGETCFSRRFGARDEYSLRI